MWIKLPNIPMKFWTEKELKEIGDTLGIFISIEKSYKSSKFRLVAYILVELDPR